MDRGSGLGWHILCGVEVTELSINKQDSLSTPACFSQECLPTRSVALDSLTSLDVLGTFVGMSGTSMCILLNEMGTLCMCVCVCVCVCVCLAGAIMGEGGGSRWAVGSGSLWVRADASARGETHSIVVL